MLPQTLLIGSSEINKRSKIHGTVIVCEVEPCRRKSNINHSQNDGILDDSNGQTDEEKVDDAKDRLKNKSEHHR